MKNLILIALVAMIAGCGPEFKYPESRKMEQKDVYFGVEVDDPYRWLEDDTSAETAAWVKAQNELTFAYLEKIPFRKQLRERYQKIWDYPKYGVPFKKAGKYFFFKNDGMQNQSVLYIQDSLTDEPQLLLDPNTLSEDGTISLSDISVSPDGKYLAYSIARGGSDWNEIYFMEIEGRKTLSDKLEWVKFSGLAWEGNSIYYSCYDAPKDGSALSGKNEFHKVFRHVLGTEQKKDVLIYDNPKYPLRNVSAGVTDDQRLLIITESESTSGNSMYVAELKQKSLKFLPIVTGFDNDYNLIDNIEGKLLVHTNAGAPRWQLVLIDPQNPDIKSWQVIIPEKAEVLQSVTLAANSIIAVYMKDASSKAYVHEMNGLLKYELQLPGLGTLAGVSGEKKEASAFYAFTSFLYPTTIFEYEVGSNKSIVFKASEVDFKTADFETKQVFYTSKDGTKVPMFIVHKKGIELNGNNPCMLYGYGGFNISLTPGFSISRIPFLEQGGIYCIANIRGGGEYGDDWHKAGTKLQKQNVFDDFIAAAEYLIAEKFTSSEKLAISGGSNGGLLVGACMTQRPELFKVALPAVGVLDMLRYHKFTIGWAWASDYGSSDDEAEFKYLMKYSPYHNLIRGEKYPATLITTADHDDRVVPAHSFKFAARLQEYHHGKTPVMIRIDVKAGHGAGKPTSKQIDEATDVWSFAMFNLGMKPKF